MYSEPLPIDGLVLVDFSVERNSKVFVENTYLVYFHRAYVTFHTENATWEAETSNGSAPLYAIGWCFQCSQSRITICFSVGLIGCTPKSRDKEDS